MIYKVRVYTHSRQTFIFAVKAPNGYDACEAAKTKVRKMGLKPKRAYSRYELDGYIDWYQE